MNRRAFLAGLAALCARPAAAQAPPPLLGGAPRASPDLTRLRTADPYVVGIRPHPVGRLLRVTSNPRPQGPAGQ